MHAHTHKKVYKTGHSSTGTTLETTQISIYSWMHKKLWYPDTVEYYTAVRVKEMTTIHQNKDEPHKLNLDQRKPNTSIFCMIQIYIKGSFWGAVNFIEPYIYNTYTFLYVYFTSVNSSDTKDPEKIPSDITN